MNGHTCGACLYFDPWINTREAGVCHRYPPSIPNAEPEDDNEPDLSPVVRHDSWCGEFKPERPSKPRPRRRA